MQKQIQQALEKMDSSSPGEKEQIRAILKRYVDGEVGLDEAYYELLDQELIPMPQRCAMHAHVDQDEAQMKEKIRAKLFPQILDYLEDFK